MSVQTTEQKKEDFRKYLEKAGVIDQLTKVLVGLYEEPEKPNNVIEFIKKALGEPTDTDVESLMAENENLKKEKLPYSNAERQVKVSFLLQELLTACMILFVCWMPQLIHFHLSNTVNSEWNLATLKFLMTKQKLEL